METEKQDAGMGQAKEHENKLIGCNDWLSLAFRSAWEPWSNVTAIPNSAMLIDGSWYVPRWGSDTLQHMMDVLRADSPARFPLDSVDFEEDTITISLPRVIMQKGFHAGMVGVDLTEVQSVVKEGRNQ